MPEILIWNPSTGITDLDADAKELSATEIAGIKATWRDQQERLKGTDLVSDFTERLGREWAIETGIIENLYDIDRGVTQTLIDQGFRAELLTHGSINRPRDLVLALLHDQKQALDGVFDFVKSKRHLSTSYIKELHAVLLRSQTVTEGVDSLGRRVDVSLIKGDWKVQPNFPVRDGVTYKYCPPEHVATEMDRLVDLHAAHLAQDVPAEVQAAWLHHRFTQIHPFQDGNGRLARAIASLVLIKHGLFPLVVTRDDRTAYLDALEVCRRGRPQATRRPDRQASESPVPQGGGDIRNGIVQTRGRQNDAGRSPRGCGKNGRRKEKRVRESIQNRRRHKGASGETTE